LKSKNYQTKPRRVKLKLENFVIPELLDRIFDKKVSFQDLFSMFFWTFLQGSEGKKGNTKARYCRFTVIYCKAEARMYQKS